MSYDLIRDAAIRRLYERLCVTIRALTDKDAASARESVELRGMRVVDGDTPLGAYFPSEDAVILPPEASADTLLHELVHWTGAQGRCERPRSMDGKTYTFEEFVAVGGAKLLLERLGYPAGECDAYLLPYLQIWTQNEPDTLLRALRRAAREARVAVNYIAALAGDALPPEPKRPPGELPEGLRALVESGATVTAIGPDGERIPINGAG